MVVGAGVPDLWVLKWGITPPHSRGEYVGRSGEQGYGRAPVT